LVRGRRGLIAVPSFSATGTSFFVIATSCVLISWIALSRLSRSKYGLSLQAIRDDSIAAGSLGKGVLQYKWRAFALGSGLAGLAGALYASYVTYVSPDQFAAAVTFYVVVGIILGGSSHWGAIVGTFIFVGLQEATQFASDFGISISDATMADIRLFSIGAVLVLLLEFRPQGAFPYHRKLSSDTVVRAKRGLSRGPAPSDKDDSSGPQVVEANDADLTQGTP
jgi:branched-chain amino acid transport system permease protein